ncbi:MAG TPA: ribbon-helix-helix protein, CopG family [Firmicutes bacterium]|nr:ribbon-helix-helix protein, CopG family [Bacillota bacterium]
MSGLRRIMVSLPCSLLEQVDGEASHERLNRSELVREALKSYLDQKRRLKLREEMVRGYVEMAEINLELAEQWSWDTDVKAGGRDR